MARNKQLIWDKSQGKFRKIGSGGDDSAIPASGSYPVMAGLDPAIHVLLAEAL
jgi:hypothetical protein